MRRVALDPRRDLRRVADERRDVALGRRRAGGAQVGGGVLRRVLDARRPRVGVPGQPDAPARERGRPAEDLAALGQQHARAALGRGQRGREARRAGAGDEDVGGVGSRAEPAAPVTPAPPAASHTPRAPRGRRAGADPGPPRRRVRRPSARRSRPP